VIIDTSVLVSILLKEPGCGALAATIFRARTKRMSVANYLELAIVASNRLGDSGSVASDDLLRALNITLEPVTVQQAILARQAFYDFGKGRHPAALNFGDCFAYALAKSSGEPLLYVGLDFARTDLTSPS
jgi:ribonuclease VapC